MTASKPRARTIARNVLVALGGLLMLASGVNKLAGNLDETLTGLHVPFWAIPVIGTIETVGALLYFVPRSRFYGGVLLSGTLAGAVLTHWANVDLVGWLLPAALAALVVPFTWAARPPVLRDIAAFAAAGAPGVDP